MSDDWEDVLRAVTWKSLAGDGEQAVFVPAGGPLPVEHLDWDELRPAALFRWSPAGVLGSREVRLLLLSKGKEALVLCDPGSSADSAIPSTAE